MRYKFIQNIKKKIFPIGFGCGIGNYNSNYSYRELANAIEQSLDLGVNFFDTAPIYGKGVSEKILGNAISIKKKEEIFIATKISPEMLSKKNILKSINYSRKNLKLDILDLVQVHWPNPKIDLYESMDALYELKKKSIIRAIGLCNYSYDDLKKIVRKYGESFISTFQTEYNLFDRTADGHLYNFLVNNNIMLLAYSPLAQGKICNGLYQRNILQEIAVRYKITVAQVILNWMSKKKNILPIPNSLNEKRIKENYQSLKAQISQKDLMKIDKKCHTKIVNVETKKIVVASEFNPKVYKTIKQAKSNKFGMVPSPISLSLEILNKKKIKPIRIKELNKKKGKKMYLIEGRLRFWAWILAFGWYKKIPSLIWKE